MAEELDAPAIRSRFPGLSRRQEGRPCVFADAPGGTQAPETVIQAMAGYLRTSNANAGGAFETSRATDELIAAARLAAADLVGCDPDEVAFGPNMTALSFSLSRAIGRTLRPGDEVVVTALDHDANISPWLLAARDVGAKVRWVEVAPEDCTLDLASLETALGPRTRVVAFTLASNAVGTITPAIEIVRRAHEVGALAVADAVHFAPHRAIDVRALDADVLYCSPYKFFGPHLGVMFGKRAQLAEWEPYKVRPASDGVPERWESGTLNHEGLAGFVAAVDYLAGLAPPRGTSPAGHSRRALLERGFSAIRAHETALSEGFLKGLPNGVRLYGIGDAARVDERVPTFALRVEGVGPRELAEELARRGVFVWDGNYYAQAIMERLGLEDSGGATRVGFCHYTTPDEVDRVLDEIGRIARG